MRSSTCRSRSAFTSQPPATSTPPGSTSPIDLSVTIADAGSVTLAGSAGRQRVEISGLGTYQGTALGSGDADLLVSGAGSAGQVSGNLDATVTAAGSITYPGSPTLTSAVTRSRLHPRTRLGHGDAAGPGALGLGSPA